MKVMKKILDPPELCFEFELENTVIKHLFPSLLFTLGTNKLILNTPFSLILGKNDGLNIYIWFMIVRQRWPPKGLWFKDGMKRDKGTETETIWTLQSTQCFMGHTVPSHPFDPSWMRQALMMSVSLNGWDGWEGNRGPKRGNDLTKGTLWAKPGLTPSQFLLLLFCH